MQNNYLILCFLFLLIGCSSNEELDLKNYKNVFKNNNKFSQTKISERSNSKLDTVKNLINIFNAKSYNIENPSFDYPLEKKWEIDTDQNMNDENPFLAEPIIISSHLFLINNKGFVFKINIDSGKIIWKKKHSLPFRGGMTVFKDVLLISDFAGNFLSINNTSGKTNWSVSLGSDYNSVYTKARSIVVNDKIVIPGTGGTFYVISIKNGNLLWTENISSNKQLPKLFHAGDIVANPLFKNGVVYLVSQSGNISAFDINTSEELWTLPIGGFETPVLSGDTIFINGNMGILAAIDIASGKVRWSKKYPSYINEEAFFSEKEIAIYKGPTLVNSKILFADNDGKIFILDPNNGSIVSDLSVGKLAISPVPADKKVFFLTENGKLLAYK